MNGSISRIDDQNLRTNQYVRIIFFLLIPMMHDKDTIVTGQRGTSMRTSLALSKHLTLLSPAMMLPPGVHNLTVHAHFLTGRYHRGLTYMTKVQNLSKKKKKPSLV